MDTQFKAALTLMALIGFGWIPAEIAVAKGHLLDAYMLGGGYVGFLLCAFLMWLGGLLE